MDCRLLPPCKKNYADLRGTTTIYYGQEEPRQAKCEKEKSIMDAEKRDWSLWDKSDVIIGLLPLNQRSRLLRLHSGFSLRLILRKARSQDRLRRRLFSFVFRADTLWFLRRSYGPSYSHSGRHVMNDPDHQFSVRRPLAASSLLFRCLTPMMGASGLLRSTNSCEPRSAQPLGPPSPRSVLDLPFLLYRPVRILSEIP